MVDFEPVPEEDQAGDAGTTPAAAAAATTNPPTPAASANPYLRKPEAGAAAPAPPAAAAGVAEEGGFTLRPFLLVFLLCYLLVSNYVRYTSGGDDEHAAAKSRNSRGDAVDPAADVNVVDAFGDDEDDEDDGAGVFEFDEFDESGASPNFGNVQAAGAGGISMHRIKVLFCTA